MSENQHNILTAFELTGNDVVEFLNNQVITELKDKTGNIVYTAICNPKGRIIFTLFLQLDETKTTAIVDSQLCDNFLQYVNLRRFRMDVQIKKINHQLVLTSSSENKYRIHISTETNDNHPALSSDAFWLHMFDLGLPWINAKTTEQFIPQHVNLDQKSIIDFDKGCYPGQEIVARLHFLGNVKKRMQQISYVSDNAFAPNQTVKLGNYESEVEFCAPSIFYQQKWHSQAILKS